MQACQSFLSIAIAYKITIKDLKSWNNLAQDATLKAGQKLFIPSANTTGYVTPTQSGAFQVSTPDAAGQIIHTVQSYQTLSSISQAYGITIQKILDLNFIQADWPLRIGQKLIIQSSNLAPSQTLAPIQLLTPANDGNLYHTVKSGETLSWIAQVYNITINELLIWNDLNSASVIHPEQKLLLKITPPASITPTAAPASETPTIPTPVASPTSISASPTATKMTGNTTEIEENLPLWGGIILILASVLVGFIFYRRNKK